MLYTKYLVIGAGISGLSFANFKKNEDYLILEKSNTPGGYCRTIYQNDFIWDYAGHFFHFRNEQIKKFFLENVNSEDLIFSKKNTKIIYKDNLIDYPFQKNIHQLEKNEFLECLYDLYNLNKDCTFSSFENMLYSKFGKSITEKFLKPYNEKLYACDLNLLDVDAMGRFFPYIDFKDVINNIKANNDNSYNDYFIYHKNGAQAFVDVLVNNIDSNKILFNESLMEIDPNNKIITTNKQKISYEYIINSIPLINFMKVENKDLFDTIERHMTYNKVLVFNLGFNKKSKYNDIHWMYIPDKSINFYRIGFYDNILHGDKLSLYVEIGFSHNSVINIENELIKTIDNLRKLKIIDDHELEEYVSLVMDPAYIHISEKSNCIKNDYKKKLKNKDIYTIGRYGDWKYCSIEDSILDSLNLSKKI